MVHLFNNPNRGKRKPDATIRQCTLDLFESHLGRLPQFTESNGIAFAEVKAPYPSKIKAYL